MPVIEFSKFVVPNASGVPTYLYHVKDEVARAAIAGGNKFVFAWKGENTPDVTKIPNTVTVRYNDTSYTGTLDPAVAHANIPSGFWLVSGKDSGGNDGFEEYVPVEDTDSTPSVWKWERIGFIGISLSDFGALAYMDSVELEKGVGANVIGENATLQSQDSVVTFDEHTTESALGTGATFNASGPTLQKDRRRIRSESITPISGTESANVTLNPIKKKMKRVQITPASAKRVSGSDLATVAKKKLRTQTVYSADAPQNVDILNGATKRKIETKPFPVSAPANTPETVKGFDIRMYNPSFHGQIDGADEETLVIKFGTTPTLILDQNPPARMATGALVQDGDQGSQAHTDYANETGGEVVNSVNQSSQSMVTGRSGVNVANGKLDDAIAGDTDTLVGNIDLSNSVDVAEPDTAVQVASGELAGEGEAGYNTTPSGEGNAVVVGASPVVTVPKAGGSRQVLLEEWTQADDNDKHINVLNDANLKGNYGVTVNEPDTVNAITELGDATAAAQQVTFLNKDLKKVALYDDLKIVTESHPAQRYLNFVTPNGGTISLNKIGSPTAVELEYSLDGVNWTLWETDNNGNRSKNVAAGERMYIRNKSVTNTAFSRLEGQSLSVNYYRFYLPNGTEVNGIVESLICRTPELGQMIYSGSFQYLFYNNKITGKPIVNSKNIPAGGLYRTFECTGSTLDKVEIRATTYGNYSLAYWLTGAGSSGIIYCKPELDLTLDSISGIPTGWTRVDI